MAGSLDAGFDRLTGCVLSVVYERANGLHLRCARWRRHV